MVSANIFIILQYAYIPVVHRIFALLWFNWLALTPTNALGKGANAQRSALFVPRGPQRLHYRSWVPQMVVHQPTKPSWEPRQAFHPSDSATRQLPGSCTLRLSAISAISGNKSAIWQPCRLQEPPGLKRAPRYSFGITFRRRHMGFHTLPTGLWATVSEFRTRANSGLFYGNIHTPSDGTGRL